MRVISRTILIITHVVPVPPTAGNEIRILSLANALRQAGYRIVLLLKASRIDRETRKALKDVFDEVYWTGSERSAGMWPFVPSDRERTVSKKETISSRRLIWKTERLCRKYKPFAVIAEYIFTAPCLDHIPEGPLKIIDTHDMFSRKESHVHAYGIEDPFSCTEEEERSYLLKADLILAIQENEEKLFKKLVPEKTVITTGIDFKTPIAIDNQNTEPGTVLVVGSDNPLNIHGLREFLDHAWRQVLQHVPRASLRIVGKVANHVESNDPSLLRLGWVPSLDVEYRRAEIVINPTVAGTGLKIKSVEALCQGKALVGTPNSIEGLRYEGEAPFEIAHDWSEFSSKISWLLENKEERENLQQRALEYSQVMFKADNVYGPLLNVLNEFETTGRHQ